MIVVQRPSCHIKQTYIHMTDRQNYLNFMLLFEPVCGSKGNPGLFSTGFPPPIERLLR